MKSKININKQKRNMNNFRFQKRILPLNNQLIKKIFKIKLKDYMKLYKSLKKIHQKHLNPNLLIHKSVICLDVTRLGRTGKYLKYFSMKLIERCYISKNNLKLSRKQCFFMIFQDSLNKNQSLMLLNIHTDNKKKMQQHKVNNKQNKKI